MTATIEINRLLLHGFHGVMAQERRVGNRFELTMRLHYPVDEAVSADDLEGTLNYAEVIDIARDVLGEPSMLLEHAAGRLREALLTRFPLIEGGEITLLKLTPPCGVEVASVGVTLRW